MAAFNLYQNVPLGKGLAGLITLIPHTDEAVTVTASKNGGNVGAVDGSTVAAKIGGTNPAAVYKLTIAAADTGTEGPIVFVLTGATDTTTIYGCRVVGYDPAKRFAAADEAVLPTDILTADALKADFGVEIKAAIAGAKMDLQDVPNATALAAVKTALANLGVVVNSIATDAVNAGALAASADSEIAGALTNWPRGAKENAYKYL